MTLCPPPPPPPKKPLCRDPFEGGLKPPLPKGGGPFSRVDCDDERLRRRVDDDDDESTTMTSRRRREPDEEHDELASASTSTQETRQHSEKDDQLGVGERGAEGLSLGGLRSNRRAYVLVFQHVCHSHNRFNHLFNAYVGTNHRPHQMYVFGATVLTSGPPVNPWRNGVREAICHEQVRSRQDRQLRMRSPIPD